jgi:type I restriction enzyme M protein
MNHDVHRRDDVHTHRILTDADIAKITDTYHAWRGDGATTYEDVPGFCKSASLDDVRSHGHVLTPGRYVGAAGSDRDGEPFADIIDRLTELLSQQFAESARLEAMIKKNLAVLL